LQAVLAEAGDHLVQKDLAKTLKLIRKDGSDAIYGGEVGEAIAQTVQSFDGSMTIEDLRDYKITVDDPVWGSYKGYDIATMPPPSSGGITLLQMMKLLEEFDLQNYDPYAADYYHLLTEAMHLAYADRGAFMGDPEFVDVPTSGLLNPDYVSERRALMNPETMTEHVEPGDPWAYEVGEADYEIRMEEDDRPVGQTTHFTLADRWGNVVSYTSTIEQLFGTGIMVPGYGLMLNNELTDFSARPGGPNEVQPHKRPLSSMTPTIVFKDGEPYMALGSPGGMTIITSVLQVALNSIEHDMTLPDAIAAPRIFSNTPAANVRWEHGIAEEIRADLQERGHPLTPEPQFIGNVQSIWMDQEQDLFQGVADFRRDGAAIGVDRPKKKKH
jgi:gamma-glutamyltranspeptidase / glutathione hydrolase